MVEKFDNIDHIKNYRKTYSEKNIKQSLLDVLANSDWDFHIYDLKKTGQKIVRYRGDNLRTNIIYDKGLCRVDAEIFGNITTFEGDNIDSVWNEYDQWCKSRSVKYFLYEAPDGTIGSYSFFKKEILKGHFHGCKIGIIKKDNK